MKKSIARPETRNILLAQGQSSRLDAIRKKAGKASVQSEQLKASKKQTFDKDLNPRTKQALEAFNLALDQFLNELIKSYPANKKISFFRLKYGCNEQQLRVMSVKDICRVLKLDSNKVKDYSLISAFNLQGRRPDAE